MPVSCPDAAPVRHDAASPGSALTPASRLIAIEIRFNSLLPENLFTT
ncbi:hypothetical protein BN133_1084 [Cronobacter dublinensis 582]|nr:hypothetical protein BN133_1084 [Cronobacter dublinensis 582]